MAVKSILVVGRKPIPLIRKLGKILKDSAHILPATSGLNAIFMFQKLKPVMVIINNDITDIFSESLASILKDTEHGKDTLIYVINVDSLLPNSKADRFISKPVNDDVFACQIKTDFDKLLLLASQSEEIEKAIRFQKDMLPPRIESDLFTVDVLYSPFNELSGDGLSYWFVDNEKNGRGKLYGYLFDCTGHDISSYGQASSLWMSFKRCLKRAQLGVMPTLDIVIKEINLDMTMLYEGDDPIMACAIAFVFDFNKNILRFCPAGNPEIILRKSGESYSHLQLRSFPLGYDKDSNFNEQILPLDNVEEVIISSDGLTELLLKNRDVTPLDTAKHDDVSAVCVRLKKAKEKVKL